MLLDIYKYIYKNINKHYLDRYYKYINSIYLKGNRQLDYKENHHIIPKCIDESLYNNIDNKIVLTPREHYIAHLILSKCFTEDTIQYNKLIFALFAMSKLKMGYHNRNYLISSHDYEKLRIKYVKARKIYMQEQIKQEKYNKLKYCANTKGKICITDGIRNKYIDNTTNIPDGWYRGSTQNKDKCRLSNKLKDSWSKNRDKRIGINHPMFGKGYLLTGNKNGRYGKKLIYVNNGIVNKMIKPDELSTYINNGYIRGMIRWNKTKPTINNSGKNNPAFGTKLLNNGTINKRVPKSDIDIYLQNGWKLGALKRY